MATTIREFVVELGVDADTGRLARFQAGVEQVKQGLTGLVQVAAAAAAGTAAVGASMLAAANKAGTFSKQILEQSRAVGVATDTYQGLVFAARKYGQEARDIQDLLSVLADRAEDATRGTSSFVEAFKLIGIEAQELKGLKPQEVLFKTADALSNMENATKRVTAAERLLGGELGQKFLPLLQKGSDGIQQLIERANTLGVVLGEDTLEQSRAVKQTFNELFSIGRGLVLRLGAELAPAFQDVTTRLRDWLIANEKLINQRLDKIVADLSEGLRGFADATAQAARRADRFAQSVGGWVPLLEKVSQAIAGLGVGLAVKNLVTVFSGLGNILASIVSTIAGTAFVTALMEGGLASAMGVLQLQVAQLGSSLASFGGTLSSIASTIASIGAGPILALAAAGAAIVAVFEDIITFFQGEDSLTGRLVAWIEQNQQAREVIRELQPVLQGLMSALEITGQVIVEFGRTLSTLVVQAVNAVIDATATLAKILGRILKPVFTAIAGTIDFVIDLFEAIVALMQGDLTTAVGELKAAFKGAFETIEDIARQSVQGLINSLLGALDFISRTLERLGKVAGANFDIPSLTKNLRVNLTEGSSPSQSPTPGQPQPAPAPAPSTGRPSAAPQSPLRVEDNSTNSYEVNVNAPNADADEVANQVDKRLREKEREQARKRREEFVKGGEA